MIVGSGKFQYELAKGWEQIPDGWGHGDVTSIVTDKSDRVYVFNRSEHPVMIYERDGTFVGSWGEGIFTHPHGMSITREGHIYCADDKDNTVRKFTLEGELLQTLGKLNEPTDSGYEGPGPSGIASIKWGSGPFNRPTQVSQAPNGDLYITDGYGNARVHRFTADGELIQSWGEPGMKPGEFNLPHDVWAHTDGRVYVIDRENDRVQVFSQTGEFIDQWADLSRPQGIFIDEEDNVYVSEGASKEGAMTLSARRMTKTCPAQVTIRDLNGKELSRFGADDALADTGFAAAHGICVDSHGDIYVGCVAETVLSRTGRYTPDFASLKKFVRV